MNPHRNTVKVHSPRSQYTFPHNAGNPQVEEFGALVAKNFPLPAPLGEILYNRGMTELSEVQDFLYPQLSMLPSPYTMKGMRQAVACILDTIQAQKPIFIHGDYDVDGITATVLLTSFFKEVGIKVKVYSYIPNRLIENYGLSVSSINRLVAQSDQVHGGVLISVDCGITAVKEVAYAKELGLRVIITDHHEPKEMLPDAEAIINPKQKGCEFPFPLLSGAGVAFFLLIALRKALVESDVLTIASLPNLKKYLDLVALGTVADVVPLVGVNRILVRAGLEVMSARNRIGVFYLCDLCGIQQGRQLQPEDIAFKLAPRINAPGRLGFPEISFSLLSTDTEAQALKCAQKLELMNTQRKQLEFNALADIEDKCNQQIQAGATGLVVYQENCHPGVVGILASRMTDCFGLPVIIFTDDNTKCCEQHLKGSGRSVTGVNLLQLLQQCTLWTEQFGGHSMAAGLTIKKANLKDFTLMFQDITNPIEGLQVNRGVVPIDYHFRDKKYLTKEFAQALQMMQPFGEGNPEPKFLLSDEQILHAKDVKGHVTFQVRANGCILPGIGFRLAEAIPNFNKPVDLIFQLKQSWFKGERRIQIQAFHFISN